MTRDFDLLYVDLSVQYKAPTVVQDRRILQPLNRAFTPIALTQEKVFSYIHVYMCIIAHVWLLLAVDSQIFVAFGIKI